MQNSFKKSFLYMMLLLALIFSAVGVTPALADDGVTPPTDAPAVEQPVGDAPVVDAPVAEQPVAEEPVADAPAVDAPAVEEPVADAPAVEEPVAEAPAAEPAAEEVTVSEILEQLPEDTGLVVLDESGEVLPLASQEAAEAVASAADPYFYDINGVKYSYMFPGECGATPNCTESSTPIQSAVNAFRDNQNATGEIFILAGTYTENVYINGFDGYLSRLTGLVGAGSGLTTFDGFLSAYQLSTANNPFTLSGITFTDWVSLNALGDVVIDDVVVTGSDSYGIQVHAYGGDVTINDSDFSNNRDTGLSVYSNGNIDVSNSRSNSNGYVNSYSYSGYDWWSGVYYSESYTQGIGNGLTLNTNNGNITLNNVSASENLRDGAYIYASGNIDVANSQFDSNGYFNSNSYNYPSWGYSYSSTYGSGLGLNLNASNGNIALSNVSATENLGYGATIYTQKDVDITDSQFNSNGSFNSQNSNGYFYSYESGNGLYVNTSGNVSLNNVGASENHDAGAYLYSNSYHCGYDSNGYPIYCSGDIFVIDSTFDKNSRTGLYTRTTGGDITLDGVTASGSTNGDGANLTSNSYHCGYNSNGYPIYCSGDIFVIDSTFDKNSGTGLNATTSGGDIALEGVTASESTSGNGANLSSNYFHCGYDSNWNAIYCPGGDIFVTDSTFDKNSYTGLNATTYGGDITFDGVTASGSTNGDGANLSSNSYFCGYDSNWNPIYCSGGNIFIVKSMFGDNMGNGANLSTTGDASVKCSEFTDNGNYGMDAGAVGGSLDLTSVTFTGNNGAADYNYNGTANVTNVDCNPVPPTVETPASKPAVEIVDEKEPVQYAPLYIVLEQAQGQLPSALETGTFGSALKVALTEEGKEATDLAITLSFPIPAEMKDANLAVMFWNGSAWVEVSGGSVVDGMYVITVAQPGEYVLVAK